MGKNNEDTVKSPEKRGKPFFRAFSSVPGKDLYQDEGTKMVSGGMEANELTLAGNEYIM